MSYHIPLSDLREMAPEDQEQELARLIEMAHQPIGAQLLVINSRIRHFELRYEKSSARMMKELAASTIRETAEIAEWLGLLETKRRVAK